MCLYGRECSWRWWLILLVVAGIGLIDESIKALLPTREFDFVDLVKDWGGVAVAVGMIALKNRRAVKFIDGQCAETCEEKDFPIVEE